MPHTLDYLALPEIELQDPVRDYVDKDKALQGFSEGEQNIGIYRFCCSLRASGYTYKTAEVLVKTCADNCTPNGYPEADSFEGPGWRSILERVWRDHPDGGEVAKAEVEKAYTYLSETSPFPDVYELSKVPMPTPRKYIVEGLIPEGCITSMFAAGGLGKSLLALYLAICIRTGRPMLGKQVSEPCNVLYIDNELTRDEMRGREQLICNGLEIEPPDGIHYWRLNGGILSHYDYVKAMVDYFDIKLIVLDSLTIALQGIDVMNHEAVITAMQRLESLGTMVVIDHCLTTRARILTRSGFKTYEQVKIGEDVLAYDCDARLNKWTPLLDKTVLPVAKMFATKNKSFYAEHTQFHNWVSRNRKSDALKTLAQMNTKETIVVAAPAEEGNSTITPREAAIIGWLITDGWVQKQKNGFLSMLISQTKNRYRQEIKALLGNDGSEYKRSYYIRKDLRNLLVSKGFTCKDDALKLVHTLSSDARKAMIDAMLKAEASNKYYFNQQNNTVLETFLILTALEGLRCGKLSLAYDHTKPQFVGKRRVKPAGPVYRTRILTSHKGPINSYNLTTKDIGYGPAWCPTTRYGTWVAELDGQVFITGNTAKMPLIPGVSQSQQTQFGSTFKRNLVRSSLRVIKGRNDVLILEHDKHNFGKTNPNIEFQITEGDNSIKISLVELPEDLQKVIKAIVDYGPLSASDIPQYTGLLPEEVPKLLEDGKKRGLIKPTDDGTWEAIKKKQRSALKDAIIDFVRQMNRPIKQQEFMDAHPEFDKNTVYGAFWNLTNPKNLDERVLYKIGDQKNAVFWFDPNPPDAITMSEMSNMNIEEYRW